MLGGSGPELEIINAISERSGPIGFQPNEPEYDDEEGEEEDE